jgi:23S rRNA (adenine2503-C2)-methyltransferase
MQNTGHTSQRSLCGMSSPELADMLEQSGENRFRAGQIFQWIHQKQVFDFNAMSNLSRDLRESLSRQFQLLELVPVRHAVSRISACEKFLFRLHDGEHIESVWMDFGDRQTVCVSSQVGCALGCRFCATATMGLKRHLDVSEILQQILYIQSLPGKDVRNVVFMGMGEPLHNFDTVCKAVRLLNDPSGLAIGQRRITVSTAGLVPRILQLAEEDVPCRLAVSLNAVTDSKRETLMPINRKHGLDELFAACKTWTELKRDRVTFEYILMDGVNDTEEDLKGLRSRLSRLPCKLNLIYYNPTNRGFTSSETRVYERFFTALKNSPFAVTLRQNMGTDISAACGQLLVEETQAG